MANRIPSLFQRHSAAGALTLEEKLKALHQVRDLVVQQIRRRNGDAGTDQERKIHDLIRRAIREAHTQDHQAATENRQMGAVRRKLPF